MRLASWASASFPSEGSMRIAQCHGHDQFVGHFLCDQMDRTLGGKYVCCNFFIAITRKEKSIAPAGGAVRYRRRLCLHAQIVETGIITGVVKDNTARLSPELMLGAQLRKPD